MNEKTTFKTVSAEAIIKAGGPDNYALTKGIDTRKKRLSGRISISGKEMKMMLEQLRQQG